MLSDEIALELAQPCPDAALLMLDLDHVKRINDEYEHSAGDEVLRTVASRLLNVAGPRDVVCRMGGDEFAVLVRPAADALARGVLIDATLREPVAYRTALLRTGGSVGQAILRAGGDEPALLREADEGLYASKRATAAVSALESGPHGPE